MTASFLKEKKKSGAVQAENQMIAEFLEFFKNSDQTSAVNPHKWREYDYYIDANVRKNEIVRSYLNKIGICNKNYLAI